MSQQNADIVKSADEAFARRNIPVLATFDPQIEWTLLESLPFGQLAFLSHEGVESRPPSPCRASAG